VVVRASYIYIYIYMRACVRVCVGVIRLQEENDCLFECVNVCVCNMITGFGQRRTIR
jgi:hypothetical protein